MTLGDYLEELYSSDDEAKVTECLKKIIKNFSSTFYKAELKSNPLFSLIIDDIKTEIILEMQSVSEKIKVEIDVLDQELLNTENNEEFLKLKDVRRECIYLLTALDNRLHGVYLL